MNKEKEIETVTLMVRRYCRGVHGTRGEALCPACAALPEYARLFPPHWRHIRYLRSNDELEQQLHHFWQN